jgi:hypothetical protein
VLDDMIRGFGLEVIVEQLPSNRKEARMSRPRTRTHTRIRTAEAPQAGTPSAPCAGDCN